MFTFSKLKIINLTFFCLLTTTIYSQTANQLPDLTKIPSVEETKPSKGKNRFQIPEDYDLQSAPPAIDQNALMEQIINGQLDALRAFDLSKAYYAYTSVDFQKTISLEDFKLFIKNNTVLLRNKALAITGVNFAGVIATVKTTLTSIDGKSIRVDYDMIQENGLWKIRKINVFNTNTAATPK